VVLFGLVYIMQFLGWGMQKMTEPKAPKQAKPAKATPVVQSAVPTDEGTMAAIAMALSEASDDDKVAVAMALYLYMGKNHDIPTATIAPQARNTAWNAKSIGMNNKGF
jgi:Na+-transporting methylmalonyl-CoA/oxaloacetate decarboxylase gamma subunit